MNAPELEHAKGDAELALEQLKKRRNLHRQLLAYLVTNAAVWGLWAITAAGNLWPAWLSGIWAIGVVFNAWDVYVRKPVTEADVQRETDRLQHQRSARSDTRVR